MLNKGTASLEVKNSERNRELENFASLEPRVCEVLLYVWIQLINYMKYIVLHKITCLLTSSTFTFLINYSMILFVLSKRTPWKYLFKNSMNKLWIFWFKRKRKKCWLNNQICPFLQLTFVETHFSSVLQQIWWFFLSCSKSVPSEKKLFQLVV